MLTLERYQLMRILLTGLSCLVDNKVTCNAPAVRPLEDAVMTCHFPEDLGLTKKDFTVYRYDKSGSPGVHCKNKLIK